MKNNVSEYIPVPKQETETFMIKRLKLPIYKANECLSQIIGNYFTEPENFIVLTSAFQGKFKSIQEITKNLQNYIVFTHESMFKLLNTQTDGLNSNITSIENFNQDLLVDKKFLIFYNVFIPFEKIKDLKRYHICAFYDYEFNQNMKSIEDRIDLFTRSLPNDFICTTICKKPVEKRVNFEFGTNHEIKHISLNNIDLNADDQIIAYSREQINYKFRNIEFINKIPENLKTKHFIFYDIDLALIPQVLKKVDNITFIYTKDDMKLIKNIVMILEEYGVKAPENIKKMC